MKCLRCKTEMKHYDLEHQIRVFGKEHQETPFSTIDRNPHNIHSVYICDNCGYAEFSTTYCEDPDL